MAVYKIIYLFALGILGSISLSSSYGIKRYPSNRMLDFNWPEPDEHIRKFPHEKYCHYYYQHESGELFTIRKCPTGNMFDYHIHECREKHTAQCWSHHYGKHPVHDHIHSKWRKHFKCPFPNGNYPDIFDCDKYIVCLDGRPHHKHCSPNQQFDKNRRHCVYAAVCANSTDAALVTHMCPYSSGNFAHLEDCSKYYHCHKSEPTVRTCEKNKLFDEEDRECKDGAFVHCKERPNPYSKMSVAQSTTKSVTTDDFDLSISSANSGTNTADTQTVEPSKQSVMTSTLLSKMSSEIVGETSVAENKATAESNLQTGITKNFYSITSSASTHQTASQPKATNNFHRSTETIAESTSPFVTSSGNSQSSTTLSNTVEPTAKSEISNVSHSPQSSTNVVH